MAASDGNKSQRILSAAASVFAAQGYHAARVAEIARAADVAHGTVYRYFASKEELLVSLFRERLGELVARARAALDGLDDPRERLRSLIEWHLRTLAADRDFAVVTQIELRQAQPSLRARIQQTLREYLSLIDEVVRDGQERGVFDPALDSRQVRNVVFGALDQTVTAWVMTGFRFDLEAQAEPTWRLLSAGLLVPEPGSEGRGG